jgi:hypothetical protein
MRKIRDALRYRFSAEISLEATARAVKISKSVVAKHIKLASISGISWPIPEELEDYDLSRLLMRQGPYKEPTFAEPDHANTHQAKGFSGIGHAWIRSNALASARARHLILL